MSRLIATALLALMLVGGVGSARRAVSGRRAAGPWSSSVIYACGSLVCHQRPDRSLTACGRQWPVCGRCSGLYLGAAAGVLLARRRRRAPGELAAVADAVLVSAIPTAALWLGEFVGLGDPGTMLRLALAVAGRRRDGAVARRPCPGET